MVNRLKNSRDKGKKPGFVYHDRDVKSVKNRAEQSGGNFDSILVNGIDRWTPKVGDNVIRILPPTWDDHDHYGYDVWVHGYVGADKSSYLCPAKMKGKRCPICEAAKESLDAGEEEEAKQLKAKKSTLVWLLDRDGDTATPQVWQMSWTMDRDIAALCHNKRTGKILLIDHPEDGYDVTIKRIGQGLKTRYNGLAVDRQASPIEDREKDQDAVLDYITENPLPSVLKFYDAAHLEKVLSGTSQAKDDDMDDDDDKPRRKRSRDDDDDAPPARSSRRSRDDDDDDEPPRRRRARDDDDEEDEKPKRRSRDDDDDDEAPRKRRARDDDDEDEAPARRRSRDDDDDEPPRKRRSRDDDDDDDSKPVRKRGSRAADDDDEVVEDDDEKPARKKRRAADDDDDEPAPRKKRAADDDDDDEPPRKRVRR